MNSSTVVQKLWNYCNVLRDDGMSYGDYVEQLTYLLFLKMADERAGAPYNQRSPIPSGYDWPNLLKRDGDQLFDHYRHTLERLGASKGLLALIFGKAQNKFQDPAKLRRLIVDLIDKENWSAMGADVKGDAYEGLLEKNAQDTKSGAGQYFTPRPLIQAIVEAVAPQSKETICDPACGTGGFLLAAHDYIVDNNRNLTKDQKRRLKEDALKGVELVQGVARLCAMNLMLHGIGGLEGEPIEVNDSLKADPGERFDIVLTNPPFGKKSSFTVVGENGEASKEKETYERDDFWATTSNKQLNFVQHVKTLLKANVLFFDKKPASETPWTKKLWIYDLRTNKHFTLKTNFLKRADLDEFVACYNPKNRHERKPTWLEEKPDGRWRPYTYEELVARDKASLDIFWLKDDSLEDSENLPPLEVIAQEMIEDLEAALEELRAIAADLGRSEERST